MRYQSSISMVLLAGSIACGGSQSSATTAPSAPLAIAAPRSEASAAPDAPSAGSEASDPQEFVVRKSEGTNDTQPRPASKIKPTRTEAALKFTVIDKDKGPVPGIIIALSSPDGKKFYTEETSAEGYAEVLVPVAQKYELVYLGLGRRDIGASVTVTNEPNQNVRLTLRYKRFDKPSTPGTPAPEPRFVLEGVTFDSGKATIRDESYAQLDGVVEYMTAKQRAQIEISGHTDNAGNPKANKLLSEKRAQACRDYLVSKGIEASRVRAVGYGDERPIASNDSEEGRKQNRRIEATEL
jgi:outer membrane protein OmpA-like peptidoglycan-associated protein